MKVNQYGIKRTNARFVGDERMSQNNVASICQGTSDLLVQHHLQLHLRWTRLHLHHLCHLLVTSISNCYPCARIQRDMTTMSAFEKLKILREPQHKIFPPLFPNQACLSGFLPPVHNDSHCGTLGQVPPVPLLHSGWFPHGVWHGSPSIRQAIAQCGQN